MQHDEDLEIEVLPETSSDVDGIRRLNQAAFNTADEARLVDLLRQQANPFISLIARSGDSVVGHIAFSPVSVDSATHTVLMGLAPMAVTPARQRQGIGSALVAAGLNECRVVGAEAVFVLGHPQYYPRFGFNPADDYGIGCEYDVPSDTFLAFEICEGALASITGTLRYHSAFGSL